MRACVLLAIVALTAPAVVEASPGLARNWLGPHVEPDDLGRLFEPCIPEACPQVVYALTLVFVTGEEACGFHDDSCEVRGELTLRAGFAVTDPRPATLARAPSGTGGVDGWTLKSDDGWADLVGAGLVAETPLVGYRSDAPPVLEGTVGDIEARFVRA